MSPMIWKTASKCQNTQCVEVGWHTAAASGQQNCVEVGWDKSSASNLNGNCVEVGTALEKSSYSGPNGDCVESGPCACGGDILVRDTKNREGGTLAFTPDEWRAFIAGAKDGEFDLD